MIEFDLSAEQRRWQWVAREFARQEVAPVAAARERIQDPVARMPWDLVRKGSKVGLRTLAIPRAWGGEEADCLTLCLAGEELAVADLGVAIIFDQCWKFTPMLDILATPEQKERFFRPYATDDEFLLATTWTEPHAGSDHQVPFEGDGAGVKLRAVRDGDDWILNGTKVFTSNGSVAKLYFVYARTDPTQPWTKGVSVFLVPSDTPGLSFGTIYQKIGQQLVINAEEVFENLRVPHANLLGPEGQIWEIRRNFMIRGNVEAGATAIGPGRAAYEAALDYARDRSCGGRPAVEEQATALILGEMAMRLEAARQLIWYVAWATDHQVPFDRKLSPQSKIFASEVAFTVCKLAIGLLGRDGVTNDYPVEKYFRDAATFLHSDGTNQVLALRVATQL